MLQVIIQYMYMLHVQVHVHVPNYSLQVARYMLPIFQKIVNLACGVSCKLHGVETKRASETAREEKERER
jgi:hypothetical protein